MSKTEHSPLPWVQETTECCKLKDAHGGSIGNLYFTNLGRDRLPTTANAQFIVTACNSYYDNQQAIDELVEALEDAVEDETEFETEWNKHARALIAKHKAKP